MARKLPIHVSMFTENACMAGTECPSWKALEPILRNALQAGVGQPWAELIAQCGRLAEFCYVPTPANADSACWASLRRSIANGRRVQHIMRQLQACHQVFLDIRQSPAAP